MAASLGERMADLDPYQNSEDDMVLDDLANPAVQAKAEKAREEIVAILTGGSK